jgi:hypothetical protein
MSSSDATGSTRTGATAAYWSSAYFLSVATLYLWAYWATFEVNILEFVGLTEIVKTALFPVASFFVFIVLGAIAGEAIFPHGFLPAGGGANTSVGRAVRRWAPAVATIYVVLVLLLLFLGPVEKWRALPVLIAIPVSFGLKEAGFLQPTIKSDSARTVVIFLIAALPPFAYGHGTLRANDIRSGKSFSYVTSAIDGQQLDASAPVTSKPRYLGKAGDTYFLFEPTKQALLVVHEAQVKLVQLQTYPRVEAAKQNQSPPVSASSPNSGVAASR